MAQSTITKDTYLFSDTKSVTVEASGWSNTLYFVQPTMSGYTVASISAISDSAALAPCGTRFDNSTNTFYVFVHNLATSERTGNIALRVLYRK